MKPIFIDTGAFLAREFARDQHHEAAAAQWEILRSKGAALCSSEHVLDECSTLLARRTNYAWAADWGLDALDSGIKWLKAEPGDLEAAYKWMRKYADQGVSYTDCVSFVLMKREKLRMAFAFDRHFEAAGFRLLPKTSV